MDFYSTLKKNKILSFVGKRMEQGNIILSEVSQATLLIARFWKTVGNSQIIKISMTGKSKILSFYRKAGSFFYFTGT
jgi:hypothetical protein